MLSVLLLWKKQEELRFIIQICERNCMIEEYRGIYDSYVMFVCFSVKQLTQQTSFFLNFLNGIKTIRVMS